MNQLIQQGPLALFAAFVVMHALADFPLQGAYLAQQKARRTATSQGEWIVALTTHGVIQAGGVWLVSGSLGFGITELILHTLIDLCKGEGRVGFVTDQLIHLGCKLIYVVLIFWVLPGW